MDPWAASVPDWITAGASASTVFGLVIVYYQLRTQRKQLNRDIENDYVQRYWQIRDQIDAARPGSREDRRWRLAYLRLCEDQIDLMIAGGVTGETWRQWDAGIRYEIRRNPMYESVLRRVGPDELVGVRRMLDLPSD